jgi:BirA family transcriptional regulator, biotin operon repressor / biotin---[acetyl-CoA-carboxylase] ligase
MSLGTPRRHHRRTGSTSVDARALAVAGAPHGTLVTAAEQTDGRGRQGRSWQAPAGSALLCSLVLRNPPPLLSIAAGVAVAELVGDGAALKWPNDVLVKGRKVAGILVEGRPQESWAVLGIGINVAVNIDDLPTELRDSAGTLGLAPDAIESTLTELLALLDKWLDAPPEGVLDAWRARDALRDAPLEWAQGRGVGAGIDREGRLLVDAGGTITTLDAGEVHLLSPPTQHP